MTFWTMTRYAERPHMEKAFTQRREQIVGNCCQLRTDIEVYNDVNKGQPPIPLVLDFTYDVEERLQPDENVAA
jgi:hypothetical protein